MNVEVGLLSADKSLSPNGSDFIVFQ